MAQEKAKKGSKPGDKNPWTGRRGARGPRALGESILRLTRPIFGQRGFAAAEVITDWPRIIGADVAAYSLPERIAFPTGKRSGGTLHLRVEPGGYATGVQHMAPQIIERINTYFGYGAVADLRIIQAPLPERPKERARANPAPPSSPPLSNDTDGDPLDRALQSLGRKILNKPGNTPDT